MVVIAAIAKEVRSLKWRSGADAFPFSVSPMVICALLVVGLRWVNFIAVAKSSISLR